MVAKLCSRSHGQPEPGVRSAAMISRRAAMSRDGFMRASLRLRPDRSKSAGVARCRRSAAHRKWHKNVSALAANQRLSAARARLRLRRPIHTGGRMMRLVGGVVAATFALSALAASTPAQAADPFMLKSSAFEDNGTLAVKNAGNNK